MKACSKCKEVQSTSEFRKDSKTKDGLKSQCKSCMKRNDARWCEENKQHRLDYVTAWNAANNDKTKMYKQNNRQKRRAISLESKRGYVPTNIKQLLRNFYGDKCMVPNCKEMTLHLDHVVPLTKEGSHTVYNFQLLCDHHNASKGNRSSADYRPSRRMLGVVPKRRRPVEDWIGKRIAV